MHHLSSCFSWNFGASPGTSSSTSSSYRCGCKMSTTFMHTTFWVVNGLLGQKVLYYLKLLLCAVLIYNTVGKTVYYCTKMLLSNRNALAKDGFCLDKRHFMDRKCISQQTTTTCIPNSSKLIS